MPVTSTSRRVWLIGIARDATIAMFAGVAIVFLMFISRQQLWSWRLALYGGIGAMTTYAFSHSLDSLLGDAIRRRNLVPEKLVGVPIYFVSGCAAFLLTTAALQAFGLLPFAMSRSDVRTSVLICGGVSIIVGLLFYSFHVMRDRLQKSIERIKEQEFAEKELEVARSIQRRLLPPQELTGEGYRISARNLAARFVAGDFYDVFRLSDGALGIVVADVSGKGVGASLIMASVKAVLPFIAEGRDAAATLSELNRKLYGELEDREFVALAYARFEPRTGALELANAGLPDPYLLRHHAAAEPLSVPGPRIPLGALLEVTYESLVLAVRPGERVLILTDGLPEAPTGSGDPLGYEALAVLVSAAAQAPGDMLDSLFAAVRDASLPGLDDDWTALVLKATPVSAAATLERSAPETVSDDPSIILTNSALAPR